MPVIVIGHRDFDPIQSTPTRVEAQAGGASAYVEKPILLSELE